MTEENEVVIDGVKYVAEDSGSGCNGCIADDSSYLCADLPQCTPSRRADGRIIIWIKEA